MRLRCAQTAFLHGFMHNDDTTELDAFDYRILERWQADTRVPAKAIADAIGLSTAAVQRRLKRLRELGVIRREVAELDPRKIGLPVTCIVGVDLDREGAADLARFRKKMLSCAEVQQCYYVTGQNDFVLVVLAADMEAYDAFTRRTLLADTNVKSFTTQVTLERVKTGSGVALPR
jgi:Lrp/AsnC family transcriptional regulator, leucine-responsive regulatory protein